MANRAKKPTEVEVLSKTLIKNKTLANRIGKDDHHDVNKDLMAAALDARVLIDEDTEVNLTPEDPDNEINFMGKTVHLTNGATLTIPDGLGDDFLTEVFATGEDGFVIVPNQSTVEIKFSQGVYKIIHKGSDQYEVVRPQAPGTGGDEISEYLDADLVIDGNNEDYYSRATLYNKSGVRRTVTITSGVLIPILLVDRGGGIDYINQNLTGQEYPNRIVKPSNQDKGYLLVDISDGEHEFLGMLGASFVPEEETPELRFGSNLADRLLMADAVLTSGEIDTVTGKKGALTATSTGTSITLVDGFARSFDQGANMDVTIPASPDTQTVVMRMKTIRENHTGTATRSNRITIGELGLNMRAYHEGNLASPIMIVHPGTFDSRTFNATALTVAGLEYWGYFTFTAGEGIRGRLFIGGQTLEVDDDSPTLNTPGGAVLLKIGDGDPFEIAEIMLISGEIEPDDETFLINWFEG